ncbi:uncharacterized protein [Amphiura filiformis]|uniref:uncharacterized protein n=1 Tax=Amphiura filiformis TaxID=82378 RepID=UPI003B21079B
MENLEIQTTGDAENMQVLQVLLELVHPQGGTVQIAHPQGGTVQIARDTDNVQIQSEEVDPEQLQNVSSIASQLASDNIVISYNGVESTLGSIQNQIQQQQLEAAAAVAAANKTQESAVYGSQLNENVIFEISRQAENVAMPVSSVTATTPQSQIVEIPILNASGKPKSETKVKTEKKKLSVEEIEKSINLNACCVTNYANHSVLWRSTWRKELKLKPHTCETCNKRFKNIGGLQNHQKLHTGEKPFKCEACDVAFANRSTFNYHNEKNHSDKVYVCQCSKTFKTKACLRAHLKNHHSQGPKRYKCQYCDLRLRTRHYKNEHERIHTNERPFKCREGCDKAFRRSGARNDHERTVHLKENKEACKYCGHMYDKREIKNHEMVHTGEKPFECPYCESRYTQRKVLNKHIRRKHPEEAVPQPPAKEKVEKLDPIVLEYPEKKKEEKKVKKVKKTEPPASEASQPATIQIQVYKCMYCVKLFNNINHLVAHEKTHVRQHHYECSTCGKTFQRPEGLTRHEGKHAGGFQCYTCGKWFNTLTKMQEHHKEHLHKCTLCKLLFKTKDKLGEHMKKHKNRPHESGSASAPIGLPNRIHQCKYCDKSFLRRIGLKEHERTHVEKVKCPLCEKTFVSYYLPKHLRTHSGDHPYSCSLCPNRHYTTPNALRTHMRRRHPVQKIEIKHKKGKKKASIQVSEMPNSLDTFTTEVTINDPIIDNDADDANASDVGGEDLPNLEAIQEESETASLHMEVIPVSESEVPSLEMQVIPVSESEVPSLQMQVTPTSESEVPSLQMQVTATSDESETSKLMVPISIANVIQEAAAANNIQINSVVGPHTVVTTGQVAQVVNEDGTITTMAIADALSQTDQETNNIISDMDTEDAATSELQDGGDSQSEQETTHIIMREIDPDVTLGGGDEQIEFTFE